MRKCTLILGICLLIMACGKDSITEEPTVPEAKIPSIKSFSPLMGIEGDTVTIELADLNAGEISSVSFGLRPTAWFSVENSTVTTVVPSPITRGVGLNVGMVIDSKTIQSTQLFQTTLPSFTSIDKPLFTFGDTLTLGGINLVNDLSRYSVELDNGDFAFDATVTEILADGIKFVRNEHPGGSPFFKTYNVKVTYGSNEISTDLETTLTTAFSVSDEFNTLSNAPGSLLKIDVYPGGPIEQTIMLGDFELDSEWSWSSDDYNTYAFMVPTDAPIGETLQISMNSSTGDVPIILKSSGKESILIEEGTFDFSPKTIDSNTSTELTFELSHVYSPTKYKVVLINQTTGEKITLATLNEENVEQNSLTLKGLSGGLNAGSYQLNLSILDDEYLLTPENGSILLVE